MHHLKLTSKLQAMPAEAADINDGTSNTILIGEMASKKKPAT